MKLYVPFFKVCSRDKTIQKATKQRGVLARLAHLVLVSLIMVCLTSPALNAQETFDEVKISFWPEYISPAMEECYGDENNARVRSSVHISIKTRAEIQSMKKLLLNQKLTPVIVEVDNFTCQMVIDFIKGGAIYKTIAIDQYERVRINEDRTTHFLANDFISDLYNRYLSFYRKECCLNMEDK